MTKAWARLGYTAITSALYLSLWMCIGPQKGDTYTLFGWGWFLWVAAHGRWVVSAFANVSPQND